MNKRIVRCGLCGVGERVPFGYSMKREFAHRSDKGADEEEGRLPRRSGRGLGQTEALARRADEAGEKRRDRGGSGARERASVCRGAQG